ncbi:flagellin lysine-N-methylase [Paenibacillus sp. MBLB2552]|uniref:Flagellin lysine-N-methylase n=1 Tax=Paenibacillus mellifer TaxID=2937794 RepID=A0A9X2BUF1_9BACL|nr:flagellin lysine-N-methylase [Paenibacillus mellifer]MCK8489021.1 flagellin lysine-N-methylase [Paenibacillus mellifer]
MTAKVALIPEYMQNFQCIGPTCEDSCCIGWGVTVKKDEHKKLVNISWTSLRNKLKSSMRLEEDKKKSNSSYAYMNMDQKSGHCFMLNDQKLCTIHAQLGESYLPSVCATYPKIVHLVDGEQECSAVLSCPEAARQALLNPDGIQFYQMDAINNRNLMTKSNLSTGVGQTHPLYKFFWDIRITSIEILQDRSISFTHRLIILGLFCDELQQMINAGSGESIPEFISKFKESLITNEELRDYEAFPTNPEFQLGTLSTILVGNLKLSGSHQRFSDVLSDYLEGIGLNQPNEDILTNFISAYNNFFAPYAKEREYIFENYAVNYVYSQLFPCDKGMKIFDSYMLLVINFVLIKMLLIGVSSKYKGLTDEMTIKVIQSYVKIHQHSGTFANNTFELLKKENYDTLGHMSLLIKN